MNTSWLLEEKHKEESKESSNKKRLCTVCNHSFKRPYNHTIKCEQLKHLQNVHSDEKSPLPQYANEYSLIGSFYDFFSVC